MTTTTRDRSPGQTAPDKAGRGADPRVKPDGTPSTMPEPAVIPRIDPNARRRVLRKLAGLLLASVALLLVILYYRDGVRMAQARDWAQRYVNAVSSVPVIDNTLPLNLAPPPTGDSEPAVVAISWIDREQARILRGHDGPVMVAQTGLIPLMIRQSGRVAIFFDGGRWRTEWVSLVDFERLEQERNTLLLHRADLPAQPGSASTP